MHKSAILDVEEGNWTGISNFWSKKIRLLETFQLIFQIWSLEILNTEYLNGL